MSPSAHRRRADNPGPEQRQQALVGLSIVLAFVVIAMIIVLERQRQPFTVGDVALPVHDLAKPVVSSSASSSAAHHGVRTAEDGQKSPAHAAGVAGVATTRSTGAHSSAPVPTTRPLRSSGSSSSHPTAPTSHPAAPTSPHPAAHPPRHPSTHPVRSPHPPKHHPGAPSHGPGPHRPAHHPSNPSGPHPSHHPSHKPTHHPHPPTSTPPSSTPPPAPSVAIAQGDAVDHCWLPGCDWINITLSNFSSGTHTITCNTSRRAPYQTFSSLLSLITRSCFMFGNDDEQVWVTVDGVQSNTITWVGNSDGSGGPGGGSGGGYGGGHDGGHDGGHHRPGHGHGGGGWGGGHHGR